MTRTINLMSGPNYRTDRTHPLRGVLSDRDPMAKPAELVLAFIIANIHWQKLVMHQMTIFVPEPL